MEIKALNYQTRHKDYFAVVANVIGEEIDVPYPCRGHIHSKDGDVQPMPCLWTRDGKYYQNGGTHPFDIVGDAL